MTGNVAAVQAVFDARNPEQYQAALANLNAILDAYNAKWAEQQRLFEELSIDVGTVTEKLTGHHRRSRPRCRRRSTRCSTRRRPRAISTAVGDLNTELDKQRSQSATRSKDALAEVRDRLPERRERVQASQASTSARKGSMKDFLTLRGAGVEINTQMRGMGSSIRDFIKDAQGGGHRSAGVDAVDHSARDRRGRSLRRERQEDHRHEAISG